MASPATPDRRRRRAAGATPADLRRALERLRAQAARERYVENDPLASVLAYADPADQEVAGLIAALLAYGRVDLLRAHAAEVLGYLGARPAATLRAGLPRLPGLRYRFHRTRDLTALLAGARAMLLAHGTLGLAFAGHWRRHGELRLALSAFVAELRDGAGPAGPGLRFLLADPARGGACKRWLLYLRWMVRAHPGDPDPGPWRRHLPPAALLIPLDTHVVRVSRRLGLTARKSANWRMAEEVTASLRTICPEDPVRYDFPLCHLGIRGICPPRLTASICARCPLFRVCPTGRSWPRLEPRPDRA